MEKQVRIAGSIFLIFLCMVLSFGCASGTREEDLQGEQVEIKSPSPEAEQEADKENQASEEEEQKEDEHQEEEFSPERQLKENEEIFWQEVDRQKINRQDGEKCLQILLEDDVFQSGEKKLTGLRIDDIDGNGQTDMLAMVLDAKETPFYGSGGLWFYINEDEPYCFDEEDSSFYGLFDAFWADVDNDENIEIVFSAQGTGCGAVGDSYKAVFKYRDHAIERMAFPSDLAEDYDQGLKVELIQEPEMDSYSAYCPYFDEQIYFRSENIEGWNPPSEAQSVGGNVRGFYDLCEAEYKGQKVLQASEYLHGEGGIVHGVADAKFLITWEEDGTPKVIKWWIEKYGNEWENNKESRISYEDGYYYYASQSAHYFLYRAGEDGSEPVCLAKVHPGSICVQDGEIYFINQSDGNGIYRMKTDGTGMEKLCEKGQSLQISAEYVYFTSTYEAEYDKSGMVTEEPSEYDARFLYRMKKDGSERELIGTGIRQFVLRDGYSSKVRYSGSVYYSKWVEDEFVISRMDLNGQNAKELCRFDESRGMMVYGNSIYFAGQKQISRLNLWDGKITSYKIPQYTDGCIYNGYLYTLNEQEEENGKRVSIYRMEWDGENCEMIYGDFFECKYTQRGQVSDIYATEEGIFFRKFVSEEEGCQWLRLTEDEETKKWKAEEWEDREKMPDTIPAGNIEYGELRSVKSVLESMEGYEAYMADDLEYEEVHLMGDQEHLYQICLPQFNSKIAGHKKINQYFQNAYQEAMKEKEAFFDRLDEERDEATFGWYKAIRYHSVYIGEKYVAVEQYETGYWEDIHYWISGKPVTFDRQSGEVVSLEKLLGLSEQEATARLTGSVYKYMEGVGEGGLLLQEEDILTKNFDPEQFFLFPEGIGIYYGVYTITSWPHEDFMFLVPWEEVGTSLGECLING